MKSSEVLRKVKAILWDGKRDIGHDHNSSSKTPMAICFCIERVAKDGFNAAHSIDVSKFDALIARIMADLHPYMSVYSWLRCKAGVPPEQLTLRKVQVHRHAWVDRLIAEYEAKGD